MLLYELADAHDHLGALLAQMQAAGDIDERDFAVQMGHVFAHLSRAWHGRGTGVATRGWMRVSTSSAPCGASSRPTCPRWVSTSAILRNFL